MDNVLLDPDDIKRIIPHRDPILLIDRVDIVDRTKKRAEGIFHLDTRSYLFSGHFPADPILPGIYLIEAMAQLAAVMVLYLNPNFIGQHFFFGAVDTLKFRKSVLPIDKIVFLTAEIKAQRISGSRMMVKCRTGAWVENQLVAESNMTGMTI